MLTICMRPINLCSNFLEKIKAISGKKKVIVGKEIVTNICDLSGNERVISGKGQN